MESLTRVLGIGVIVGMVSGCTAYSGAINSLGPERPVSDLYKPLEYEPQIPLFCPAPEIVMVMPEEDKGIVSVSLNNGESYVLEGDYSAISITEQERRTYTGNQAELMGLFKDAIEALPAVPTYENLYFENGSTALTSSSMAAVQRIAADLASRPVTEVRVIGHTDTTASAAFNQQLSVARAELVRDEMIKGGVEASRISVAGRGETDLLVETADNVAEARNRRVVINVR